MRQAAPGSHEKGRHRVLVGTVHPDLFDPKSPEDLPDHLADLSTAGPSMHGAAGACNGPAIQRGRTKSRPASRQVGHRRYVDPLQDRQAGHGPRWWPMTTLRIINDITGKSWTVESPDSREEIIGKLWLCQRRERRKMQPSLLPPRYRRYPYFALVLHLRHRRADGGISGPRGRQGQSQSEPRRERRNHEGRQPGMNTKTRTAIIRATAIIARPNRSTGRKDMGCRNTGWATGVVAIANSETSATSRQHAADSRQWSRPRPARMPI